MKHYLYHHGIKGQKWGVRRYQNADGSLTSTGQKRYSSTSKDFKLNKNHKLYRWSTVDNESFDEKRKYASISTKDVGKYSKLYDDSTTLYLYEMTPIKKLKVAGYATTTREILKQYGDKSYKDIRKSMSPDEVRQKLIDKYGENGKMSQKIEDILDLQSSPGELKIHGNSVVESLRKKGYSAVVDVFDKTTGFGDTPILLINPGKSVQNNKTYDFYDADDKFELWRNT